MDAKPDAKPDNAGDSRNEGEGNKTAAREFNAAEQRFVKSGKVDEKAREAEAAIDGDEAGELQRAESAGKARSAGEDPALKKR